MAQVFLASTNMNPIVWFTFLGIILLGVLGIVGASFEGMMNLYKAKYAIGQGVAYEIYDLPGDDSEFDRELEEMDEPDPEDRGILGITDAIGLTEAPEVAPAPVTFRFNCEKCGEHMEVPEAAFAAAKAANKNKRGKKAIVRIACGKCKHVNKAVLP